MNFLAHTVLHVWATKQWPQFLLFEKIVATGWSPCTCFPTSLRAQTQLSYAQIVVISRASAQAMARVLFLTVRSSCDAVLLGLFAHGRIDATTG